MDEIKKLFWHCLCKEFEYVEYVECVKITKYGVKKNECQLDKGDQKK